MKAFIQFAALGLLLLALIVGRDACFIVTESDQVVLTQFGRPIGEFQAIKHKLADIKIFTEAARSLCYRIAWCKDQGRPLNHLEAAVAKLFVGDWSLAPANDAVVLFGGYGYCHEYEVERYFRDSRLAPIGGGTSEIQKRIISKLMQWA